MNAPLRQPEPDESIIDQIVRLAVDMVLIAVRLKSVAMCALIRIAGEELARLEGHECASIQHAKWARIHHERGVNALRGGR